MGFVPGFWEQCQAHPISVFSGITGGLSLVLGQYQSHPSSVLSGIVGVCPYFFFFSFLGQYQAHPSSVAGADTDPAAALPTAPGGSAAAPGAEANPTGPKGPGPRAEPGGKRLP